MNHPLFQRGPAGTLARIIAVFVLLCVAFGANANDYCYAL